MNKNLEEALKILTELESNIDNVDDMELSKTILLVKDLIEGQLVVNNLRSEYVISTTEKDMINNNKI
tara:strand:- start:987 stop:1187 length:201 start_codon:yes stop_codon:yes gene_type:complete